jgi:hypothetical protein
MNIAIELLPIAAARAAAGSVSSCSADVVRENEEHG